MKRFALTLSLLVLVTTAGMPPARTFSITASKPPTGGGGGGPTTLFTDNFTRADSTNLGANWTENGSWDCSISGNALRMASSGAGPAIVVTSVSAHADTADVTVSTSHATTGADGGPIARCTDSDTSPTGYMLDVFGTEAHIYRYNNSATGTEIGSGAAGLTMVAGGVAKLEVSGTGATVTLKAYYQGVLIINTTDTSGSRLTTAGRTGVHSWVNGGTTARDWDNFVVTTP